jgi:hypothetical protein
VGPATIVRHLVAFTVAIAFVLGVYRGPLARDDEPVARARSANPGRPTLLAAYTFSDEQNQDLAHAVYRPFRQYADSFQVADARWGADTVWPSSGGQDQWDFLLVPNEGIDRIQSDPNWLTLTLNRAARISIVWHSKGVVPAWLAERGWVAGDASGDSFCGGPCPTYARVAGPGPVVLGGVNAAGDSAEHDVYYVLLEEADGTLPPLPGQLGSPAAQPNQPCPGWVHDQYVTTGPDGKTYLTWHPQIDPVYWCYFGHEHGSNPDLFLAGYKPPFGYADAVAGTPEAHAGFKLYAVTDANGGKWLFMHHMGSSTLQATCEHPGRFHEVDVAYRAPGARPAAKLFFTADFGMATDNANPPSRLQPSACPDQGLDVKGNGRREIPTNSTGGVFYEPWIFGQSGAVLGLQGAVAFNTLDQMRHCDTVQCTRAVPTGLTGTHRYMQPNRAFGLLSSGTATGTFYTDPSGVTFLCGCQQTGVVQQYLAPGLNVRWTYPNDDTFVDSADPGTGSTASATSTTRRMAAIPSPSRGPSRLRTEAGVHA